MDFLKRFINAHVDIDEESANEFIALATLKKFSKNEVLIKAGELNTNFFILKSGLVKSFYLDQAGKTHTRSFISKMRTAGDITALLTGQPGRMNFDCLMDTEVYIINFKEFENIAQRNHGFSRFYNIMLSKIVLIFASKLHDLSVLNGTERYLKLKQEIPEIENLVAQYQIAAYLNITAVQLSRIRKDLLNKPESAQEKLKFK